MKRYPPLVYALLSVFLAGCELFSDYASFQLVFEFPACWQETFAGSPAELVIVEAGGVISVANIVPESGHLSVRLKKETNSLVVLYPAVINGKRLIRPFGAVFPGGLDQTTGFLRLSPEAGFAAERLCRLAEHGVRYDDFNAERLVNLLVERGNDPNVYNPVRIETDIANRSFNTYSLVRLPARDAMLLVGPGMWFSETSFSALYESDGIAPISLAGTPYGFHTLFRCGAAERVSFYLSEREIVVFTP